MRRDSVRFGELPSHGRGLGQSRGSATFAGGGSGPESIVDLHRAGEHVDLRARAAGAFLIRWFYPPQADSGA
jgi:hypothetical protein